MRQRSINNDKQTQKSIISYVPKANRGKNRKSNPPSDDDDDLLKNINDEDNSENDIEEALRSTEKRRKYIKKHYTYLGYTNNHSIYGCNEIKFEDGIAFKCDYKERDNRLDLHHTHKWVKIDDDEIQKTQQQTKSISEYDLLLKKIIILAGYYNLNFSVIESDQFWDLLQFVFKFGQSLPKTNVDYIIKRPSHSTMRERFIITGQEYHNSQIQAFSRLQSVSLTLDAGTIVYGHFLDYSISSPFYDITPYLYEADFEGDNTSDYIKLKTETIIKELYDMNVNVGSITGDNYPAQLYALCNWSKTALWRETKDSKVKQTIYFSCICHLMQLIADDVDDEPFIKSSVETLHLIRDFINERLSKYFAKVPCEVETRWFSRFNTLKFLLNKEKELFQLKDDLLNSTSVSETNKSDLNCIISQENFESIKKYTHIMLPIYSSTLFFNSNNSKVSEIIPIINQIIDYWKKLKENDEYLEYTNIIDLLLDRLKHRMFHLQDLPLLYFIYSLTPGGRVFARKMLKKEGLQIEEDKYDLSTVLDPVLPLKMHDIGFKIIEKKNNASDDLFAETYDDVIHENAFEATYNDLQKNGSQTPTKNSKTLRLCLKTVKPIFNSTKIGLLMD